MMSQLSRRRAESKSSRPTCGEQEQPRSNRPTTLHLVRQWQRTQAAHNQTLQRRFQRGGTLVATGKHAKQAANAPREKMRQTQAQPHSRAEAQNEVPGNDGSAHVRKLSSELANAIKQRGRPNEACPEAAEDLGLSASSSKTRAFGGERPPRFQLPVALTNEIKQRASCTEPIKPRKEQVHTNS